MNFSWLPNAITGVRMALAAPLAWLVLEGDRGAAIVKHTNADMHVVSGKALCELLQPTPSLIFVGEFSHSSQQRETTV